MSEQPIRILSVEDREADTELASVALSRAGIDHVVRRVDSEVGLRAAIVSDPPDLILSDFNIPGFGGDVALSICRQIVPDTPFIFVSGAIGEDRAVESLRNGATDYVLKDHLDRLVPVVARALQESRDRAERKDLERALRESEERYRYAALAMDDILWDWDCREDRVWFSAAIAPRLGWGTISGRVPFDWWLEKIHPDERPGIERSLERFMKGSEFRWIAEYRFQRGDGDWAFILDRAFAMRDDSGSVVRMIGAMMDRTTERRHRAQIEQERRFLDMILRSLGEGVVGMDRDRKIAFANPAATRITGWSVDDLLGRDGHWILHERRPEGTGIPMADCAVLQAIRDGKVVTASDDTYWTKDGTPIRVDVVCSPIFEEDEVSGAVVVFRDVTRELMLDAQLEHARRVESLGRVAATIVHEFNNILQAISPQAEVMRRRVPDDPTLVKCADNVRRAIARGTQITQDILRFGRPGEPALQDVHVESWLHDTLADLRGVAGSGLTVELETFDETLVMRGDPNRLHQVLYNLVSNARDASRAGTTVRIVARHPDGEELFPFGVVDSPENFVQISVEDEGSGMTEEVARQIFEPLFTTKRNGTGLGLAVAWQIVASHGGHLFVDSTEGTGTTFHMFIPLV